jgi:hypothetical protein
MRALHLAISMVAVAVAASPALGGERDPSALLQAAFDARFDCPITGVIEIETHKGDDAALKRRMDVAMKSIGSRLHTYAIFREPQYVRGVAFLAIEPEVSGESEERFVYLPSMRKIRRVSGSQSDDAFLGTDLSYHDFERQRGASYQVDLGPDVQAGGEAAFVVTARPRKAASYAVVEHTIAAKDSAILETRYFKKDAPEPYKKLWMERAGILEQGACRVPTRIRVEDRQRGTETTLSINSVRLDAELSDDLFSMVSLETKRPIPGL